MVSKALVVAALLVLAGTAPATAVATGGAQGGDTYTGTYVSFGAESGAVTNYRVAGRTVVESVAVQSTDEAEASGELFAGADADVDLAAVTGFTGASVSLDATAETGAVVRAESGAELRANDNDRGVLVVDAGSEGQYVRANLSSDASAEADGEGRVVVTKADGTEGAFLLAGEGNVTVNEAGNVTAELGADSKLVYRQYADGRSESERAQERLITSGRTAAEVYYGAEGSGSDTGGRAVNVVRYDANTTVEVTERSADGVTMTVERSAHDGKVVVASVPERAVGSTDGLAVTVDGEAAAEVESYGEVEGAIGGDRSAYTVRSASNARATTDVVIGVNHFSARELSVRTGGSGGTDSATATVPATAGTGDAGEATSTDSAGETGGSTEAPTTTTGSGPGFGVLGTVTALLVALLGSRRHVG